MDAIALLEKHHEEVLQLLTGLERSEPGRERKRTFQKLQRSLLAHMFIEEETFYPMVVSRLPTGDPIAEGYEEHSGARVSLARCALALKSDELFQMRIGVLEELISHHVREERESIFPQVKKALDDAARAALGVQLEEHFNKALRSNTLGAALNRKTTARELRALDT